MQWDFCPKTPLLPRCPTWPSGESFASKFQSPLGIRVGLFLTIESLFLTEVLLKSHDQPVLLLACSSTLSSPPDSGTILLLSTMYTGYQRPQFYN